MSNTIRPSFRRRIVDTLTKSAILLFVLNEIRGAVMFVPVLYAVYHSGGTMIAIWVAVCSVCGIILSIAIPLYLERKFDIIGRLRSLVD